LQKREDEEKEFEEEDRKGREEEKQKTIVHEERIENEEAFSKETKIEEALTIPIITLEKPSFETYILKLNIEVPEVKKEEVVISVPFVKLQVKPSVVIGQKFNDKLVSEKQEEILPTVPILRLETLTKVQVIQRFDEEIRRIKEEKLESAVPFYVVEQFPLPEYLESFNSNVLTISRANPSKEETKVKKVEIKEEKISSEEAGVPSGGEEEISDFLEFSLGSEGGKIRGKGPKIILFKDVENDSYINFLENICLRIYKEIEGGEPKAEEIKKMDDLNEIKIERWLEAGGKIFTINLDKLDINKRDNKIDQTHLWERLEETYSSKLGFIIFTTRNKEKFETFEKLLQNINYKSQGRLNIAYIVAGILPQDLIKLSSGMIDLTEREPIKMKKGEVEGIPTFSTFDYKFNQAHAEEKRYFEIMKNEERGLFKYATVKSKEESELHYNIKVFIVRYLVNKLRKEGKQLETTEKIKNIIKTEEKIDGIIPDVQVVNNEVYEVETLFGEGEDADTKIVKTIDKYTNNEKVNIVMDNFGFLLHLKDLERIKKDKKHNKNVEFYTLDLKNKELISIEEFKKELRKVL